MLAFRVSCAREEKIISHMQQAGNDTNLLPCQLLFPVLQSTEAAGKHASCQWQKAISQTLVFLYISHTAEACRLGVNPCAEA